MFSKGVHLVVPRLSEARRVLAFFADDGRLFFVIPMGPCSSIGTTDARVDALPAVVEDDDREFILDNINARLALPRPLSTADVIAERCGVRPLVVSTSGDQSDQDWTALSRKHVIEVDRARRHVSIFGGKLTDCINVGREIVDAVARLGIALEPAGLRWYGEGTPEEHRAVLERARSLGRDEAWVEPLWRRHGRAAKAVLELVAEDPRLGDPVVEGGEVIRAEAVHAGRHELCVRMDDFLRRRTRLEQVVPPERLAPVLPELSRLLFGDAGPAKLADAREPAPVAELGVREPEPTASAS